MRYSFIAYILVAILTWITDFLVSKYGFECRSAKRLRNQILFLFIPSIFSATFFTLYIFVRFYPSPEVYLVFQYWLALYLFIYLSKAFYLVAYTALRFLRFFKNSIINIKPIPNIEKSVSLLERRSFLSNIGMLSISIPFFSIGYGIFQSRFDFRKVFINIKSEDLPSNFFGFKIVQISDIHISTFYGFESKIKFLVDEINSENPDLIIFTGDLINNFSEEVDRFIPILLNLKASIGKLAILGNHDYGDYSPWNSVEEKAADQQRLRNSIKSLGFRLLLNEMIAIHIDRQEIGVCGVENWGHKPFPKYGDLEKAASDIVKFKFNILLTHDPDHWEAEVVGKKDFQLTLSGHTHGFQSGFEWNKIKWSTASWKFKRWGGLYKEGNQCLYVNRGIGSIGLPARVGMQPEITIITLIR